MKQTRQEALDKLEQWADDEASEYVPEFIKQAELKGYRVSLVVKIPKSQVTWDDDEDDEDVMIIMSTNGLDRSTWSDELIRYYK